MHFTYDSRKAATNFRKHKVSFEEAMTVFGDPFAQTFPDDLHSDEEDRWITLGVSSRLRLLFVSHMESADSVRIIGARVAEPTERKGYEEHKTDR